MQGLTNEVNEVIANARYFLRWCVLLITAGKFTWAHNELITWGDCISAVHILTTLYNNILVIFLCIHISIICTTKREWCIFCNLQSLSEIYSTRGRLPTPGREIEMHGK